MNFETMMRGLCMACISRFDDERGLFGACARQMVCYSGCVGRRGWTRGDVRWQTWKPLRKTHSRPETQAGHSR